MNASARTDAHNRLKDIRTRNDLSQAALGEKIGLTKMQVSNLERGHVVLNFAHVRKLAEALKCYPSDFLDPDEVRPSDAGKIDQALLADILEEALSWREGAQDYIESTGQEMGPDKLAKVVSHAYKKISKDPNRNGATVSQEVNTLLGFLADG